MVNTQSYVYRYTLFTLYYFRNIARHNNNQNSSDPRIKLQRILHTYYQPKSSSFNVYPRSEKFVSRDALSRSYQSFPPRRKFRPNDTPRRSSTPTSTGNNKKKKRAPSPAQDAQLSQTSSKSTRGVTVNLKPTKSRSSPGGAAPRKARAGNKASLGPAAVAAEKRVYLKPARTLSLPIPPCTPCGAGSPRGGEKPQAAESCSATLAPLSFSRGERRRHTHHACLISPAVPARAELRNAFSHLQAGRIASVSRASFFFLCFFFCSGEAGKLSGTAREV